MKEIADARLLQLRVFSGLVHAFDVVCGRPVNPRQEQVIS